MMKALVRHQYGGPGVVRVEEVERPALEDDRVLVRVHASSLNKADWHRLRGWPLFLRPDHARRRAAPEERRSSAPTSPESSRPWGRT